MSSLSPLSQTHIQSVNRWILSSTFQVISRIQPLLTTLTVTCPCPQRIIILGMDNCKSLLTGLPVFILAPPSTHSQSNPLKICHVSPLLQTLQWLSIFTQSKSQKPLQWPSELITICLLPSLPISLISTIVTPPFSHSGFLVFLNTWGHSLFKPGFALAVASAWNTRPQISTYLVSSVPSSLRSILPAQ